MLFEVEGFGVVLGSIRDFGDCEPDPDLLKALQVKGLYRVLPGVQVPRPSSYPLVGPKYPLLGTIYPQLRVQGRKVLVLDLMPGVCTAAPPDRRIWKASST